MWTILTNVLQRCAASLGNYLSRGTQPNVISIPSLVSLQDATGEQLSAALDTAGVRVVLVDQSMMGHNAIQQFMATVSQSEWKPAAKGGDPGSEWVLLVHEP